MSDRYGTHLPWLIKAVEATTGPVLELGIGASSTPVLHRLCAQKGRLVVSYDSDSHYVEQYANLYRHALHRFHWVSEWDNADIERRWSVVLVDHRPARRRYVDAARVAEHAEYVICHDTEPERDKFYKWARAFKHYQFRFDDDGDPRTTILSNFHSLDWLKGDGYEKGGSQDDRETRVPHFPTG